ncbi:hypothetical protein ACFSTE_02865 [Aquimarina hainanensis]|uniref:Uncharacterized protein n=1 Tax=Aquimarina hainanensis TaxID=1578017 RepID=A0ABW5N5B7_9FLAO
MKKTLYFIMLSIGILSCSKDNIEESNNALRNEDQKDKKEVSLVFNDNDPKAKFILKVAPDYIEFSKDADIDFEKLEYMVAGQIDKAPEGFLRKIKSVRQTNSKTIVETVSAELNDLTPNTDYKTVYNYNNFKKDYVTKTSNGDVVTYSLVSDGTKKNISLGSFNINLNRVIYDADGNHSTTHDQIKANGSVKIQPSLDLKLRVFFGSLQEFKSVVTFKKTTNLDLTWNVSHSLFSHSIPVAKINLPPTTFWAGWIPVVVTHTLDVTIDANGSVSASITGGLQGTITVKKGMHYQNNNWKFIHDVNSSGIRFKPVTASARFDASLILSAGFESSFYGSLGVGIKGGAGLYAEGSVSANTDGEASIRWFGGIKANIGLYAKAGLFGIPGLTFRYDHPIYDYKYPLTEGTIPLGKQ